MKKFPRHSKNNDAKENEVEEDFYEELKDRKKGEKGEVRWVMDEVKVISTMRISQARCKIINGMELAASDVNKLFNFQRD